MLAEFNSEDGSDAEFLTSVSYCLRHRNGRILSVGVSNEVEGPVSHLNSVSRNYKAVLADGFAGAVL